LRSAGVSIAYRPQSVHVANAAQHVVRGPLTDILPIMSDERRDLPA
jgi:hypothetical protein